MRSRGQVFILVGLLFVGQIVLAQNCDALLNHGVYNIRLETSEDDYQYQLDTEFCSEEYSGESTSKQKSISASYKLISGSYGSSTEQIKEYQKSYCDQRSEFENRSGSTVLKTQTLYDNALAAWSRCNELVSRGLDIAITISPSFTTATYGIRYTGATQGLELQGVYISPEDAFTCSGQLNGENVAFGRETKAPVTNQQIAMTCERTSTQSGEFQVFQEANISIHTNDKNLDTFFPQVQVPEISDAKAKEFESRISKLESSDDDFISQLTELQGSIGGLEDSTKYVLAPGDGGCPIAYQRVGTIGFFVDRGVSPLKGNPAVNEPKSVVHGFSITRNFIDLGVGLVNDDDDRLSFMFALLCTKQ